MEQLDIFQLEDDSIENERINTRKIGFDHRLRLYNEKEDYVYMAVPSEMGVDVVSISIDINPSTRTKMSLSDYERWVKSKNLKEVKPKPIKKLNNEEKSY